MSFIFFALLNPSIQLTYLFTITYQTHLSYVFLFFYNQQLVLASLIKFHINYNSIS